MLLLPSAISAQEGWRKFNRAVDVFFLTWDVMDAVERTLNPRLPPCPSYTQADGCVMPPRGGWPLAITNTCDVSIRAAFRRNEEPYLIYPGETLMLSTNRYADTVYDAGRSPIYGIVEIEFRAASTDNRFLWNDGVGFDGNLQFISTQVRYKPDPNRKFTYPLQFGCNRQ